MCCIKKKLLKSVSRLVRSWSRPTYVAPATHLQSLRWYAHVHNYLHVFFFSILENVKCLKWDVVLWQSLQQRGFCLHLSTPANHSLGPLSPHTQPTNTRFKPIDWHWLIVVRPSKIRYVILIYCFWTRSNRCGEFDLTLVLLSIIMRWLRKEDRKWALVLCLFCVVVCW